MFKGFDTKRILNAEKYFSNWIVSVTDTGFYIKTETKFTEMEGEIDFVDHFTQVSSRLQVICVDGVFLETGDNVIGAGVGSVFIRKGRAFDFLYKRNVVWLYDFLSYSI